MSSEHSFRTNIPEHEQHRTSLMEALKHGEVLPLVDNHDNLIGWRPHKNIYGKKVDRATLEGVIVRTAAVAAVRRSPETGEFEMLVQQRATDKKRWGGRFDLSISEHVNCLAAPPWVEPYAQTAARGFAEELKYSVEPDQIAGGKSYKDFYAEIPGIEPIGKMVTVFVYPGIVDLSMINYNGSDEVSWAGFMSGNELVFLLEKEPERLTPTFKFFLENHMFNPTSENNMY